MAAERTTLIGVVNMTSRGSLELSLFVCLLCLFLLKDTCFDLVDNYSPI